MTIRIFGAGLGRTGTNSLKLALEQLFGAPCYHMLEVFNNPAHVGLWLEGAKTGKADLETLMQGYAAAVDWPAAAFWRQAMDDFPDAKILLSLRDSEKWYASATETIFQANKNPNAPAEWREMVQTMFANFTPDVTDKAATIAAFEAHNDLVKKTVPADRLIVWDPKDGWGPICEGLGIPVPAEPFPHTNTREQFKSRMAGNA